MPYIEDRWIDKSGNRKSRYGKGTRFRVMEREGGQLRACGYFDKREDAQLRSAQVRVAGQTGISPDATRLQDITVGWVLAQFKASPIKISRPSDPIGTGTCTQYLSNGKTIVEILGPHLSLPELTRLAVAKLPQLVDGLKARGLGPSSVNAHLKLLSTFYKLGAHYGKHPTPIPAPSISKYFQSVPKQENLAFTPDDMKSLIASAPDHFRAFIMLAAFTGMRVSEIRGLRRNDISITNKTVAVRQQAGNSSTSFVELKTREKGKRALHIPTAVTKELQKHLDATAQYRKKREDLNLVFPTRAGTLQSAANITNREWTETRRAAALSGLMEAADDFDVNQMEALASAAKESARSRVKAEGKKGGAVRGAGNRAYHEAAVSYLSAQLPDEHPAVVRSELFAAVDFHHLRRSFATQLFIESGDIVRVAAALGDTVQTVYTSYIIETPEAAEAIKAATENLYRDKEGSMVIEVDTAMADWIVAEFQEKVGASEKEATITHTELDADEAKLVEAESLVDKVEAAAMDVNAIQAFSDALERDGTLTSAVANLPSDVLNNAAVIELLNSKMDEEKQERLMYERLHAKFGGR